MTSATGVLIGGAIEAHYRILAPMSDGPMQPTDRPKGLVFTIRSLIASLTFWVRRALGLVLSVVQRDSITALRAETEMFSAAAVESATYLGGELRAIEERLGRLEDEISALRELLDDRDPAAKPSSD